MNLIEYSINLESNAKSIKRTLSRYIVEKREFANRIFSKLKDAKIIMRYSNS